MGCKGLKCWSRHQLVADDDMAQERAPCAHILEVEQQWNGKLQRQLDYMMLAETKAHAQAKAIGCNVNGVQLFKMLERTSGLESRRCC